MREHERGTIDGSKLPHSWAEFAVQGAEVTKVHYCEFGFAEEVIAMIELKSGEFEVGIGESLRPYQSLYRGTDRDEAQRQFEAAIEYHVNL
jgi:hypothetical protein